MEKTKPKMRKGIRRQFRPNGTGRRITTLFMSLVLVLSLVAPMLPAMEVQAGTATYTDLIPTADDDADALAAKVVKFNGYDWYIIEDYSTAANAGRVTLLAKDPISKSKFDKTGSSNAYGSSTVKAYLDGLTAEGGDFADVAGVINSVDLTDVSLTGAKLYLLSKHEVYALPVAIRKCSDENGNFWWLRSPESDDSKKVYVVRNSDGSDYSIDVTLTRGVRPALQLDLSSVIFSSGSKTFTPKRAYSDLVGTTTTVKFNGMDWYIIEDYSTAVDAGSVTLLMKECISSSVFSDAGNDYKSSTVKSYLDGLTSGSGSFAKVAGAIKSVNRTDVGVTGAKLYLLSYDEAKDLPFDIRKCNQASGADINYWWLRTKGALPNNECVACVCGNEDNTDLDGWNYSVKAGIRPALQLDLSAVSFSAGTFTIAPVATPEFSPAADSYSDAQLVTISTKTQGATIYYTTDGTTPTTGSTKYTGVITVDETTTIKAIAVRDGLTNSAVASATYTILTPYSAYRYQVVNFNGIEWYLIKDNSESETSGNVTLLAKDPIAVSKFDEFDVEEGEICPYSGSMVQRYLDYLTANGGDFADVAVVIGSVDLPDVYVTGAKLYLLSTEEANALPENIRKCSTEKGGDWWLRSQSTEIGLWDCAAHVSAESGDVNGIGSSKECEYGVRPALQLNLSLVTFDAGEKTFTSVVKKVETPVFSPAAGTYTSAQNVMISTDTVGATIYYTTDGTKPTTSSIKYTGVISVDETATIKAIAVADGMTDSKIASAEYTISAPASISYDVTFKVVNGSWDDGTTEAQKVTLTGAEGDTLKLTAAQIPAAGKKPADGYKAGSWDVTPSTAAAITKDTVYTYTYAAKDSISAKVTFKVVNGSWDDGTTETQTVTLTGAEGDTLKLTAAQIPAVGTKPEDGYKAGSWDVTPSTDTAITKDTVYTYTYTKKEETPKTDVTGVILNKATLELEEGKTGTLEATVAPGDATDKEVTWKSDDTTVATVGASGRVTAVKAGTTTITVTATNGTADTADDKTATCTVTVSEEPVERVDVTGVTLEQTTLSLTEGESGTLKATVAPVNATDATVTWKSDDTTVATVDASGKVTAVKAGTTTITVTAINGTEDTEDDKEASCEVTVSEAEAPKVDVTGVTLDKATLSIEAGKTETLTATVEPDDATDKTIFWSSSDADVVTVDSDGKITAVKAGTAKITVTATNGTEDMEDDKEASCEVTVTDAGSEEETGETLEKQEDGSIRYIKDGSWQSAYTGLICIDGIWYYVENGVWIQDKYAFIEYEGYLFLVANGVLAQVNGLQMDPNSDKWYFCAEGQVVKHTGLVEYDNEWFYVENGVLDTGLNALVEYDGGLFYVAAGRIVRDTNGLQMDPNSSDWYFIALGEVQVQYTGLAFYDDEWFYVVNGKLAVDYTGPVEYDGEMFNVVSGMVK